MLNQGMLRLAIGAQFEKGLRIGTGQANVKRYNRQLCDMITEGRAKPGFMVSHEPPLEEAPIAYQKFDRRVEGSPRSSSSPKPDADRPHSITDHATRIKGAFSKRSK